MGEALKYNPEIEKGIKIRELKELTEDERAQYEEAINILSIDRHSKERTGASEEETNAYVDAIRSIKDLNVREGRQMLIKALNDRDWFVITESAKALGEIGLPQDIKAMKLRFSQFSSDTGARGGNGLSEAMQKIEKRAEMGK